MTTRLDVLSHAYAALNSTDDPYVRQGIILLRDALANGELVHFSSQVERTAQGLIVLCPDPRQRLGIAALSHMLGATVLPAPIIRIEQEEPLPLPCVVMIDAPAEVMTR